MKKISASDSEYWFRLADAEVRSTIRALPLELRRKLDDVPVLLEQRPGPVLLDDGLPDDLLGVFDGPCHGERVADVSATSPTIILFVENLRDEVADAPDAFRQEVRTTLLHEIGHYLGLDEGALEDRDLE